MGEIEKVENKEEEIVEEEAKPRRVRRRYPLMSRTYLPAKVAQQIPPKTRRWLRRVYAILKGIAHYAEAKLAGLNVQVEYRWEGINPVLLIRVNVDEILFYELEEISARRELLKETKEAD